MLASTAWVDPLLTALAAQRAWSYHHGGAAATEPTAYAALALLGHGRLVEAAEPLAWLSQTQAADGSLGMTADLPTPGWPTALAMLAWATAERLTESRARQTQIDRAAAWLLEIRGETTPRNSSTGHDTTLVGWPWVEGTHSWAEPTSLASLALAASGRGDHPRRLEALRLIADRLLPAGGCNYGNTIVLGQELLPHIQPSGMAMIALAGSNLALSRVARTLHYLAGAVRGRTATVSLCAGLMGLTAHGKQPGEMQSWLEAAAEREFRRGPSPHKLALVALAALGPANPMLFHHESHEILS